MTHPVAVAFNSTAALIRMGWAQGSAARDADNEPCAPDYDGARSWCLSGAMSLCSQDTKVKWHARCMLQKQLDVAIEHWNDVPERTIEEVLVVLAIVADEATRLPPLEEMADPSVRATGTAYMQLMAAVAGNKVADEYKMAKLYEWYAAQGEKKAVLMNVSTEMLNPTDLTEFEKIKEELVAVAAF